MGMATPPRDYSASEPNTLNGFLLHNVRPMPILDLNEDTLDWQQLDQASAL